MKSKILLTLFLFAAGLVFSQSAIAQKANTPAGVTNAFYRKYISYKMSGLPTPAQIKGISPYISKEIVDQIRADRTKQKAEMKAHPDEKPSWIEGDLFSSMFEGATSFRLGEVRPGDNRTEVDVHLAYKYKSDATEWMDTAVLEKVNGRWVITDILYKANWAFKSGASLRNTLKG
jgi:hypothetical protein